MRRHISDIIKEEEIKSWNGGDRILISSMTGSGKTQWVKDSLYQHCKKKGKRILLLSNRNVLKRQNEIELSDKMDVITLKNYQTLEARVIMHGSSMSGILEPYDYIVFDECHYWFSDSEFNRNTDLMLDIVRNPSNNKVYIYMTATPDVLLLFHNTFEHVYPSTKKDKDEFFNYGFVESIYFYNSDNRVETIIDSIDDGDRCIYFSSASNAYALSREVKNSAFVCSENNAEYSDKSSKPTLEKIEKEGQFSEKVLCTTTVLDTGLSISSKSVRHIILDILDPITLIQSIGRKRILEDEKIILYIKNRHNGQLVYHLKEFRRILKYAIEMFRYQKEMGKENGKREFQRKYARKDFDNIIQNDFEVNTAKYYQIKFIISVITQMLHDKSKEGYKNYICKQLGIKSISENRVMNAESHFEKKKLSDILEDYVDKKLFKDEQEILKYRFFENIFSPKREINYRRRGIHSMNSIMEEDGLPYVIVSRRDWKKDGGNGKRYWSVVKTES